MKKSMQAVEDFYENKGYTGEKLRKALQKDKAYQRILRERKKKLTKKFNISKLEQKKYVLSTDEDYEILAKIKKLEKMKLSKEEKIILRFLKSQLEHDWRRPLLKFLNEYLRK